MNKILYYAQSFFEKLKKNVKLNKIKNYKIAKMMLRFHNKFCSFKFHLKNKVITRDSPMNSFLNGSSHSSLNKARLKKRVKKKYRAKTCNVVVLINSAVRF